MSEVDFNRAGAAADAIAGNLQRARTTLDSALTSVEQLEGRLLTAVRDASRLTEQAVSLATDPALVPVEPRTGELSFEEVAAQHRAEETRRDALGVRLAGVRAQAEELDRQLTVGLVTGIGPDADWQQNDATSDLASSASALMTADNALDALRQVEGHDEATADRLQGLAGVLRGPVERSQEILQMVGTKLENARITVAQLSRGDYLSTEHSPAVLAHRIAAVGQGATAEIGMAQRELARIEGGLDASQRPARDAARGSADLAALKGFNPPVPEERRTNAGSSQGAAAGSAGRERGTGSAHEV